MDLSNDYSVGSKVEEIAGLAAKITIIKNTKRTKNFKVQN